MKEPRHARSLRDRKTHLSPDAERLVATALGLANSGSRSEDRYWETALSVRLSRLLEGVNPQAVYDALDRLNQTDGEAYGALIEAVEDASESLELEVDGQAWDCLLVLAPLVAWTRFRIPAGLLPAEAVSALSAHWQAHVLARDARFCLSPFLLSIDQLPRDFSGLRKATRKLGALALSGQPPRRDAKSLPETAEMLADTRFLMGVVAVPRGQAMFRWQELDAGDHSSRVQCLEQWIAQARPNLEPVLAGCGFECLLPDAYHINLREADRRVRPYAIRAAVHFLTHAMAVEPSDLRAAIAAFGSERVDEFRVGLSVEGSDDVVQGVVWPLLGAEAETDEPSPLEQVRDTLRDAGVTEIRVWPELNEPEYCEDCGAPLYPDMKGEIVHAEMPDDVEPEATHFH
ncbi:MAG: DUF2863 family protein [Gammaproteobacteria bacterium]|jgi:hypothetical protein